MELRFPILDDLRITKIMHCEEGQAGTITIVGLPVISGPE